MRSICTNNVTGPEAIVIAAMGWWIQETGLREEVSQWALTQDPTKFLDKTDGVVGTTVLALLPRNSFLEMLAALDACPATRYMLDMAASQWSGGYSSMTDAEKLVMRTRMEEFLRGQFANELSLIFKATGFFEKHKKEIAAAKAKHKAIRKVIES